MKKVKPRFEKKTYCNEVFPLQKFYKKFSNESLPPPSCNRSTTSSPTGEVNQLNWSLKQSHLSTSQILIRMELINHKNYITNQKTFPDQIIQLVVTFHQINHSINPTSKLIESLKQLYLLTND